MTAFWGDENGDSYYYEAHVGTEQMRKMAIEFEREHGDLDADREAEINSWESHQYWVKWDPDDDEAPGDIVTASTPGAVASTRLG